jgi:hypothetical protein
MSRGRFKRPAVEPSRPKFKAPDQAQPAPWEVRAYAHQPAPAQGVPAAGSGRDDPGPGHGAQAPGLQSPRRPATGFDRPSLVRVLEYELVQERAEELSQAGLVLTVEQARLRRDGADRRALQGRPWLPPDDAA